MWKKWILGVAAAAVCLAGGIAFPARAAEEWPSVPANQHPRVLITAEDVPKLRERMAMEEYQIAYEKLIADSEVQTDGRLEKPQNASAGNFNDRVLRYVEANSFRYLTEGREEYAKSAVSAMLNYFDTYEISSNKEMQMREAGDILYIAAISYDWCYDTLSAGEKQRYLSGILDAAGRLHIGYPPVKQGAVVGHGTEAQLFRDLLSAGIAVYDEEPQMFDSVIKRLMEDHIPARKFVFQAGFYHQGTSYGAFRGGMEFLALQLLDAIGYPNAFGEEMGKMPYHLLYARRPDGGLIRDGDAFAQNYGSRSYYPKLVMHAAGYYKDPYLMQEFLDQMPGIKWTGKGWDMNYISPTEFMLFFDSEVEPKPLSELPYTRYFPGPVGAMIARTGWDTGRNANAVVAEMKVGEYQFVNHAHSDAGQFEIYYKGGLATDTGIYQGTNSSYGSAHDLNYNKRTIAHNTMLVYDPNEKIGSKAMNDGGQRLPNDRGEPLTTEFMLENGYQTGEVLAHDFGPDPIHPDYSALKGDLTKAYSAQKLEDFKRSFVFLNQKDEEIPAVLVVYDKVTATNAEFKKYWLLHSTAEPDVDGNTAEIVRKDNGYTGKLVNQTLLPRVENTVTEVVEGFDVFGEKFDTAPKSGADNSDEGHTYRIQVSPKTAAKTDYFLNVMQVMDSGTPVPLSVQLIENSRTVGAKIGDQAVLFQKDGGRAQDTVSFEIKGQEKKLRILVNDLSAGLWLINREGQTDSLGQAEVKEEAGTLYFSGPAGKYTLTKMTERLVPEPRKIKRLIPQNNVGICVELDGVFAEMKNRPMLENGIVMMPMAETFSLLGKEAEYDSQTKTMRAETENGTVTVEAGRKYGDVGGIRVGMEQSVRLYGEELYVPLSFLPECFRVKTAWSDYFREVTLTNQPVIRFEADILPANPEAYPIRAVEVSGFQEGNGPLNALDNDLTTRWAVEGQGEWGIFDLGSVQKISGIGTAWHQGNVRTTSYEILLSEDGRKWEKVYAGAGSGTTDQIETVKIQEHSARYVKIIGQGNSANAWNSLTEIEIYGG